MLGIIYSTIIVVIVTESLRENDIPNKFKLDKPEADAIILIFLHQIFQLENYTMMVVV